MYSPSKFGNTVYKGKKKLSKDWNRVPMHIIPTSLQFIKVKKNVKRWESSAYAYNSNKFTNLHSLDSE